MSGSSAESTSEEEVLIETCKKTTVEMGTSGCNHGRLFNSFSVRCGMCKTITANGTVDDIQYANMGCVSWQGGPKNRCLPVGWVSIKRNLWCGGTRLAGITGSTCLINWVHVSVTEKKEWLMSPTAPFGPVCFHLNKVIWISLHPWQTEPGAVCSASEKIKSALCWDNAASLCTILQV